MSSLYSVAVVTLMGNLVRDPETRVTPKGMKITEFSLAINNTKKNPNTGKHEDADALFMDCISFGDGPASILCNCRKGDKIVGTGNLEPSNYDDKETGKRVYRVKSIIHTIALTPRTDEQADRARADNKPKPEPKQHHTARRGQVQEGDADDDVPF